MADNGFPPNSKRTRGADRIVKKLIAKGDITDMSVCGYLRTKGPAGTKPKMYRDNTDWYLVLERYHGNLGAHSEPMKLISSKLKEKQ